MIKAVVSGSRGFIAKSLIKELTNSGYLVHSFDDDYFLKLDWKKELLNILNTITPDVVFHVGACSDTLESDVNYMMIRNYESTKVIMDWCKDKNIPMVYSSSAANYGINNSYPSNLYGWSKYVAEDYVISNGGIGLRYFNVYGPGEENKGKMSSVAYQMFIRQKENKSISLFPGKPQRDFVYVKDVVSANLYAYENYNNLHGEYYEVGSGNARTFEDVLDLMEIQYEYTEEDRIPNGYQYYTCSLKEKWMLGWEPQWNLEKGIKNYKIYLENI